jgi:hypothetical protein
MVMDEALRLELGRDVDLQSDEDTALFNAAWDVAKRGGFQA